VDVEAIDAAYVLAEVVDAGLAALAFAAGERAVHRHGVARLEAADAIAHGSYAARAFSTDHERQLPLGEGHAAKTPHIDVVECHMGDVDLHLARAGRGRGVHLDQAEVPVTEKLQGAHGGRCSGGVKTSWPFRAKPGGLPPRPQCQQSLHHIPWKVLNASGARSAAGMQEVCLP
jgi:hypothetical protein